MSPIRVECLRLHQLQPTHAIECILICPYEYGYSSSRERIEFMKIDDAYINYQYTYATSL